MYYLAAETFLDPVLDPVGSQHVAMWKCIPFKGFGLNSSGKYLEKTKLLLWVSADPIKNIHDAL